MSDLDARVRALWDIEQIKQLKARYFRFVDARDWTALRSLFTDDCTFRSPGTVGVNDPDGFVARVEQLITPGVSVHQGHTPEITLDSADEAHGIWAMYDYLELESPQGTSGSHGYGYYLESYRRVDGVWKISSWELSRIRVDRF